MTIDEAFVVLRAMDGDSLEPFTPAEREALQVIGTDFQLGTPPPEQMQEFEALVGIVR